MIRNKLFKGASLFLMANIVDKAIPFLVLPLFTKILAPDEFGMFAQFSIVILLANSFIGLSAEGALNVYYFKDNERFPDFVSSAIRIVLTNFLLFISIFLFVDQSVSDFANLPPVAIWASLINACFFSLFLLLQSTLRVQGEAATYATCQVLRTITDIGLSALLVFQFNLSWHGRMWGIVIANVIWGLFAIFYFYKKNLLHFTFNKEIARKVLSFALPLLPHAIGGWLLASSDRFLVNKLLGPEVSGKYAVGFTLGMLVSVITQSFNQAWAPHLFKELSAGTEEAKKHLVKITYRYFGAILVFAAVASFGSTILLNIFFTNDYQDSQKFIPFISIAFAFDGMYLMVTNYIFYSSKTHLLSIITICSGVFKLVLSYFMISHFGEMGAAVSVPISYLTQFLLTWYIASRVYKMPW